MGDSAFITNLGLTIGQSIKENTFFDITKSYNINQFVRAFHPTNGFLYFFKSKITGNQGHNPFEDKTNQYWDYVLTDTIKVDNPFSLGMTMRSMTTISHPSWLKSDAIAKGGTIYQSMYDKLLDVNTTGTSGTITIGSTTYNTKEKDGFVVISATDWQTIYSNYGIVAQFGIDTTNQQFYLPYGDESKRVLVESKKATDSDKTWYNLYSDGWCEQGGLSSASSDVPMTSLSIPYKDTNYSIFTQLQWNKDTTPAALLSRIEGGRKTTTAFGIKASSTWTNAMMWMTTGYSNVVEGLYNHYYDYYYVGETLQNAGIINISNALNKINNALYKVASYYSATYNYEVLSDGTCEQWGYKYYHGDSASNTTITLEVPYLNTDYNILLTYEGTNSIASESEICVMKDYKQTTSFQVRHGTGNSLAFYWRTKGRVDLSIL